MNAERPEGLNEPLAQAEPAGTSGPDTPGELLRGAREQRGISIQQAAEDLHLDVRVVEAIESNRFLELGAPVYAKGHLRKYAMLLGLSPEAVIECYQTLRDTPVVPTPVPTPGITPDRPSMAVPLTMLAAVIVAVVAWWAFDQYERSGEASRSAPVAAVPAEQEPALPVVTESEPAAVVAESIAPTDEAESADAIAPTADEQAPRPAAPSAAEVQLRMEFAEASWVEVYDGDGTRLLFEVGQPGEQRTVAGAAPLQVVLGVASAVTAHVNDEPIVVPRVAGRDATRFRIGEDGTVQ